MPFEPFGGGSWRPPARYAMLVVGLVGRAAPAPLPPAPFPRTSPTHRDVGGRGAFAARPKITNVNEVFTFVIRKFTDVNMRFSWGYLGGGSQTPIKYYGGFPPSVGFVLNKEFPPRALPPSPAPARPVACPSSLRCGLSVLGRALVGGSSFLPSRPAHP